MKVLIIGSGGREHTLAWKISQSDRVQKVFCAPGNAGTAEVGENVALSGSDLEGLAGFAQSEGIDLTVVGPEASLVTGIVDHFRSQKLRIAGPTAQAAQLEGSKVFTKRFLSDEGIPTAAFEVFDEPSSAETSLKAGRFQFPTVVKADGLAAGKGVLICHSLDEALRAVETIMRDRKFGESGNRIVVEEFLQGEEASFMVFSDGENFIPMVPSQDHKAIYDGDKGPNTGGMGAYSVDFLLSSGLRQQIIDDIIEPTIVGMANRGIPFEGVLYAGLMLTEAGPKVLEYNVRFGDPETQVVVPRFETDLVDVFEAMVDRDLANHEVRFHSDAAVCVVIASGGYPAAYKKGLEITGLNLANEDPGTTVFHAGTTQDDGKIITTGGRVLGVTALSPSLESAIMKAYEGVNRVHFEGMYYRKDIAEKGLRKLRRG